MCQDVDVVYICVLSLLDSPGLQSVLLVCSDTLLLWQYPVIQHDNK